MCAAPIALQAGGAISRQQGLGFGDRIDREFRPIEPKLSRSCGCARSRPIAKYILAQGCGMGRSIGIWARVVVWGDGYAPACAYAHSPHGVGQQRSIPQATGKGELFAASGGNGRSRLSHKRDLSGFRRLLTGIETVPTVQIISSRFRQ
ncbi:hypothetical protein QUB70_24405 [Microcoleus sp. A003_D6]|uniref:hypothetical protein n=1 Tax=Microcoleus sp. A003_D6 TaxID=3055266 RepID=UPI002FD55566